MSLAIEVMAAVGGGSALGGLIGAGSSLWVSAKKTPAEVDSIIVNGASTAVQALAHSLAAETARADRAEAKVADLSAQFELIQDQLNIAREQLHSLAVELSSTHPR